MEKKLYPASGGLPEFILIRKKMKRIILRINDDGVIQVSAPERAALRDIRDVINKHLDWLDEARARKETKLDARPRAVDGDRVEVCGRSYPLRVKKGSRNLSAFSGGVVTATVTDPEDEELVAAVLEALLRKWAKALFEDSLSRMYPLIKPLGAPKPALKVRKMTSRWGSCNVKTKEITISLYLARAPMELIDSVVLHELVHLVNFPHDERFHAISAQLMPDYKIRRKKLNSLDIMY